MCNKGQNCITVEHVENFKFRYPNGDLKYWDVCVWMGKNWLLLMLPQSLSDQREEKEREKERGGQSRVRTPILHSNLAFGNQPDRQTLSSSPFTAIHLGKHPPTH